MLENGFWRGLARPTIGKKFALLFAILFVVTLAGAWGLNDKLTELNGAATQINLAGSLRWMIRDTEVQARRVASGSAADRRQVDERLQRFEEILGALRRGGTAESSTIAALPGAYAVELGRLDEAWGRFRYRVSDLMDASERGAQVGTLLDLIHGDASAILAAADGIAWNLARDVEGGQADIRRALIALGLLDGVILLLASMTIRHEFVRPLERLAEASRRIAGGRYDERLHHHSHDEIGQLTESFDAMAQQVARNTLALAEENRKLRAARTELKKLHHAVEHGPATVIVTDRNGIIEYVNAKFTEVTGYAPAEVIGQQPSMLKSNQMPSTIYAELWGTLKAGREWRGQLLNRKKNGETFWEDTWISPVTDDAGATTHYIAVKEDVTDRRRIEQERARMSEVLEQQVARRTAQLAAMNKELEAFSYSVSHDLRAPLRAVHGFAHLMGETCAGCANGDAQEYLGRIRRAGLRMGDIIDDLLDLSRVSRSEIRTEQVDLSAIARAVLAELAEAEPERQAATRVDDDISVRGDRGLLRTVMENLLGNAWKFTSRRGLAEVTVGTTVRDGEPVVFVRDNGAGFSMEHAGMLFAPFQRLHRVDEFGGSGIGLATVKRIVLLHGGRIWAESAPDRGATFFLAIPAGQTRSANEPLSA